MKNPRIISFLIVALINISTAISLNGVWTVDLENYVRQFNGTVPGGIYSDLLNAHLIPDTFFKGNDVSNRWIGRRSVTYTRLFEIDKSILDASRYLLIFDGLDTFATISVNNRKVGTTSNMFLRHLFDVKDYLQVGNNRLNVTFASAIEVAKNLFEKQSESYVVPPVCVPIKYNGECHVNHIRKCQASFSWDWGPAVPSMGIWKNVELVPVYEVFILESYVDVISSGENWNVNVSVEFAVTPQKSSIITELSLKLPISDDKSLETSKKISLNASNSNDRNWITLVVPKKAVELWWPNGYGDQKLYSLKLKVESGKTYTELEKRIGFRTIELVQHPVTKGRSFYFRVNDIAIFAKGSNWIPASIYPELSAREDVVRHLLTSSRDVHMNMLRVWGGGYYESDYFYDLADEYGIMIWQDFMFACSMYPTNEEFLISVREEVRQNVQRLKHHPSIVLWAGNNENEAALYGDWYGTASNYSIYKEDYYKLYVLLIKQEVESLDSTRPFVVSSPSDGSWTEEHGFIGPNPYSNFYGDIHYYNYMGDSWNINQYPIPRFSSEYGFQSIPSLETLRSATDSDVDLTIDSDFMKHRQHLLGGSTFMKFLISKNLRIPKTDNWYRDFQNYIYLSQVHQAVAMKIQSESYRQMRCCTNDLGEGGTMGALYWQLNDVWQAPSWSSIDFAGRWKMLHYYVQDFFAPVIVSPRLSTAKDLTIYIVSDKLSSVPGCQLTMNIYNWTLARPAYSLSFENVEITENSSKSIKTFCLNELLREASCGAESVATQNCFIEFVLRDGNGELVAPINYLFPAPLKDVVLPVATVTASINDIPLPGKLSNHLDYEIEVKSQEVALFVWLELPGVRGRFSENGFHLINRTKTVVFHANQAITSKQLSTDLRITTLSQLYV